MAYIGVGSVYSISVSGTSACSTWINHQTQYLRCVAIGASAVHVAISTAAGYATGHNTNNAAPEADATNFVVTNQEPAVISLNQVCSQPVVGITTGVQTYIDFPEGTGSQFIPGQAVNLYVQDQDYYDGTVRDVGVTTVYTGSVPDGYNSTRIGLNTDTSGIATAYTGFGTSFAELRANFKVAAMIASGSGPGTLLVQQVQIVGS